MKTYVLLMAFSLSACNTAPIQDPNLWQVEARQQTVGRVAAVISQLQADCDSSLVRAAQARVDSIKRLQLLKPVKNKRKQQTK